METTSSANGSARGRWKSRDTHDTFNTVSPPANQRLTSIPIWRLLSLIARHSRSVCRHPLRIALVPRSVSFHAESVYLVESSCVPLTDQSRVSVSKKEWRASSEERHPNRIQNIWPPNKRRSHCSLGPEKAAAAAGNINARHWTYAYACSVNM